MTKKLDSEVARSSHQIFGGAAGSATPPKLKGSMQAVGPGAKAIRLKTGPITHFRREAVSTKAERFPAIG